MGPEKFTDDDYRVMLWASRERRKKGYVPPPPEILPDPTDWESRARAQGWQPPRYPDKRQGNVRQNRRKSRKG